MFHTEKMQKVRIVALEQFRYELVSELHRMGIMDIRASRLSLDGHAPDDELSRISDLVVSFDSALAILKGSGAAPQRGQHAKHMDRVSLLEYCGKYEPVRDTLKLSTERKEIQDNMKSLEESLGTAEMFSGIDIDFSKLTSESMAFKAYIATPRAAMQLKDSVAREHLSTEIIENVLKAKNGAGRKAGDVLLFVAVSKYDAARLDELARGADASEVDMALMHMAETPDRHIAKLHESRLEMKSKLADIGKRLQEIGAQHYVEVASLAEMLEVEHQRASISSNFKRTGKTFIVEGWVPARRVHELDRAVEHVTRGMCHVEEVATKELAPTFVNRPKVLKPFDFMVSFYSLPRSDEFDPTWIFIGSFLIFYGIMVSDVGYGIMSLALAMLILRVAKDKEDLLYNVAKVWELSAVSIIFFGIISNSFLGMPFLPFKGVQLLDWTKGITDIILISIFVGVAQVCLGQVLGFYNSMHHKEHMKAASKALSLVFIGTGIVAVSGWLFHAFGGTVTEYAAIAAIVSFIATAITSGKEAVELTSLIAHPLSYTRLLGFGMASAIIAMLIDVGFTPTLDKGILTFAFMAVMFLVLHTINMVLGIFEGTVQSARLNFVEFFSKFYIGSGDKYRPYAFERHYTKD